jgi:uncharacterized membrane protein YjgN (DUF898 family)
MSSAETPLPVLTYDGRISDLYRIYLINLLLNIVTLGIWRFWGITRIRRYVWSRFSSAGSRFEYDGTGLQLFLGFLLAMLVIFGLAVVDVVLTVMLRPYGKLPGVLPFVVFDLLLTVLALGAPFSAQRYRLSHTVWRGVRGGMDGSMLAYGALSLRYNIYRALSLFQLAPWVSLRLFERRVNASFIGNQRFDCHSKVGKLYLRFLLTFLGVVALGLLVFGSVFVFAGPLVSQVEDAWRNPVSPATMRAYILTIIPAYIVFGFGAALISASYSAAFYRHVTSNTTLAGLRFGSEVSGVTVLMLGLGNAAILLFTLGLGMPIVIHRNARYFATNLLATGALDVAAIGQSEQRVSRFGEGMFQVLDAGAGLT